MPKLVVSGAALKCTMGLAPSSLTVIPHAVDGVSNPAANIDDFAPNTNVPPFGMCQSTANPQVQSATAAASGTLTPQPCVPVLTAPWSPGSTSVTIRDRPAVHDGCTCNCQWAGVVSVTSPGQTTVEVD